MVVAAIFDPTLADRRKQPRPPEHKRPIDLVHLARATDGDESLEAELLSMFDRQSEKLCQRVKLADLPRRARADIAHRLRGSALAIGAFARRRGGSIRGDGLRKGGRARGGAGGARPCGGGGQGGDRRSRVADRGGAQPLRPRAATAGAPSTDEDIATTI